MAYNQSNLKYVGPLKMELTRRKKKKGTPDNGNDKAKKEKGGKGRAYALLVSGMSIPYWMKKIADAKKGNF
tara:strand:- start:1092 stop:1304 length:213 start_codon:yes stop_codon:yes gene_type:complete